MTDLEELIKLLGNMSNDREGKIRLSPNDISDIKTALINLDYYRNKTNNGDLLIIDIRNGNLLFSKSNQRFEIISYEKGIEGKKIIELKPML